MKAKRGKCLALVAVLAMVVCAFAIAMPSGESDAAVSTEKISETTLTKLTRDSADVTDGGAYYVGVTGSSFTVTATGSSTIYLAGKQSIAISFSGSGGQVTVKLAVDNGGSAPTMCYAGLELVFNGLATVSSENGTLQTVSTPGLTSKYGISTTTTGANGTISYYPEGSKVNFNLTATAKSITIRNGTSTVTQGSNTLKAVDFVDDTGLTVTYVDNVLKLSGSSDDASGSATVTGGYFKADAAVKGINAVAVHADSISGDANLKGYMSEINTIDVTSKPFGDITPVYQVVGEVTQKTSYTFKTGTPAVDDPVAVTVNDKAALIIQKGVTLNANVTATDGTLKVFGTLVSDDSETTGNIFIGPEGFVKTKTTNVTITGNTNVTSGEDTEIFGDVSGILQTSVIGEKGGKKTLTVPEGQTLTLNGDLGLNGGILTVNGTFVIADGSSIYGGVADSKIVLGPNGKIVNNGKIAVNYEIVVSDGATTTPATVTIQGVSGVEFSYVDGKLSVAGDIKTIKNSAGTSKVTLSSTSVGSGTAATVGIAGDLTVGSGVTFTAGTAATTVGVPKGATVTVDGDLVASPVLGEGAKLIVNGTIAAGATVSVTTGEYNSEDNTLKADTLGTTDISFTDDKVTGFTVYGKRVVENDKYLLKAFINGTIADGDTAGAGKDSHAGVTFTSDITVAAGESLVFKNNLGTVTVTDATFYVLGTVTDESASRVLGENYIGAHYVVSTTSTSATGTTTTADVGYYTPIAKAMAEIDNAKDKTVTIIVKNLDENITVGNGQTVDLTVSGTVGADAVVTYDADSKGTAVIGEVKGKVVVSGKSAATPSITTYASLKTDSDGTRTYSGFEVALKEANAGDVIEISSDEVGSVIIPAGVTVKVTDKLTINGNLTIPETAKLVGGTIEMKGASREVNVQGELDLSNGTITAATNSNYTITSTGKTVLMLKDSNANGAYYMDTAGNYVLTSVAKAVAYANENESVNSIEVVGTYTETAAVTLDGVNMTIVSRANVTLGDVTLVEGTKITATGTLTANVISKSGAGNEAAVKLTKASATLDSKKVTSAAGADTYTFTVKDLKTGTDGSAEIVKGAVKLEGNPAGSGKLTVDSGAELLIDTTVDATSVSFVDNGTVTVSGDLTIGNNALIAGTLAVAANGTVTAAAVTITGTVTVDAAGTFKVSDRVDLGTAATTLGAAASIVGKVTFVSGGYIVAYPGSDMSKAVMETVKSTKFHVNDTLFATAYALSGTIDNVKAVTKEMVNAIVGFDDLTDIIWLDSNGVKAEKVGDKGDVYVTLTASKVDVTISSATGLSVWVDGVKYSSGATAKLTVGEHKVQVTVNPGYKGDAAVTFNGAAVSNGTFTVTADMVGETSIVLSAAGNISVDTGDSGSGSSIAEILLIVLVVLAAVLVVLVALRMMRS